MSASISRFSHQQCLSLLEHSRKDIMEAADSITSVQRAELLMLEEYVNIYMKKKYHKLGFNSYVIDFSLHVLSNRGVTELLWVMGTSTHRNESTRRLPGCLSIKPTDRYHVFLHSGSQTVPGRSSVFVLGQKANAMRPRPPRPFWGICIKQKEDLAKLGKVANPHGCVWSLKRMDASLSSQKDRLCRQLNCRHLEGTSGQLSSLTTPEPERACDQAPGRGR